MTTSIKPKTTKEATLEIERLRAVMWKDLRHAEQKIRECWEILGSQDK